MCSEGNIPTSLASAMEDVAFPSSTLKSCMLEVVYYIGGYTDNFRSEARFDGLFLSLLPLDSSDATLRATIWRSQPVSYHLQVPDGLSESFLPYLT